MKGKEEEELKKSRGKIEEERRMKKGKRSYNLVLICTVTRSIQLVISFLTKLGEIIGLVFVKKFQFVNYLSYIVSFNIKYLSIYRRYIKT